MDTTETPPFIPPGQPSIAAIYAPSPVYLTGEEWLRVTSFGNAANVVVAVTGRILMPDNTPVPIAEAHTPNSDRTKKQTLHPLSEGWLLGLDALVVTGSPVFGQVWVCFELVRGGAASAQVVQALGMGFLTKATPLIWPGAANLLPLDGPGNLRSITGTTPGAGAEISETVPAGARWDPLSFRYVFTTSATVANRNPDLTIDDGANEYFRVESASNFAASGTFIFTYAQGFGGQAQGAVNRVHLPLTTNGRIGAGHRIRTSTLGIQAGDQYSAVQYLVREWMTGE